MLGRTLRERQRRACLLAAHHVPMVLLASLGASRVAAHGHIHVPGSNSTHDSSFGLPNGAARSGVISQSPAHALPVSGNPVASRSPHIPAYSGCGVAGARGRSGQPAAAPPTVRQRLSAIRGATVESKRPSPDSALPSKVLAAGRDLVWSRQGSCNPGARAQVLNGAQVCRRCSTFFPMLLDICIIIIRYLLGF